MNTESPEHPSSSPEHTKGSSGCVWLTLILLLLGGAGFAWWRGYIPNTWLPEFAQRKPAEASADGQASGGAGKGGKGGRRGEGRPVPVVVANSHKGDLPIYLNGLGTVTALNTVTIRTRVDGAIDKVNFTEGQHVTEGDILVEIDPRPFEVQLKQAQGQLAKDQASLTNARTDLVRYQSAGNSVTKQAVDTAAANVAQFEGALKSDQAQVDNAQLQLTYSRIIAPISGRIGLRLVDRGNIVHASDANGFAVITQLTPITVIFNLAERLLPQILKAEAGGKVVPAEAFDREMKSKLATGKLLAVDSSIDQTTATIRCRALFENKDEVLFPNQFVNMRLLVDTQKDVMLVPLAALQHSPKTDFLYIVKEDQTVEMRPVTAGTSEGELLIIEKGISADEIVVVEGVDKLQPGMKVTMPQPGEDALTKGGKSRGGKSKDGQSHDGKPRDPNAPGATSIPGAKVSGTGPQAQ